MRDSVRNLGLKVLSIALATLLWFLVAGQRDAERAMRAPLEFQNIPAELELIGEPPSVVDVRVRGTSGSLGQLQGSDLVATLDLRTARPGRRLFHLSPADVVVPSGVRVLQVTPAMVSLTFEASGTKTVPVVPNIDDQPAAGYVIREVRSEPSRVEITGPVSVLRQINEATTEPVSVRGARETVRDTVAIGLPDPAVRLKVPRGATITVDIGPAPIERTFVGVPIEVRNIGAGLRADLAPPRADVHVHGSAQVVRGLPAGAVPVYVDATGLSAGQYMLPVLVDAVPEATVERIDPVRVRLRLRR